MESFREFIVPITIFLVAIWVAVWKEKSRLKSLGRKINEDSYQRYAKFYGNTIPKDANFINQIKIIYYSIVKDGETDVKKIAEKANCTYTDCILKIRYLKNKRKLADYYYIDEVNGITYEEVMNGHSKIRNKGIANIFSQMGLVEAWGSGIKRIFNAAKEYELPEPKFQEFDNMFRVELFRNYSTMIKENEGIGEASEKHRRSSGILTLTILSRR